MPRGRWDNYSEFYRASRYGAFPQEHRHSLGRLPFRMILVEQGPHDFADPSLPETVLALPLAAEGRYNWRWTIEGRSYRQQAEAGEMLVVPADVESRWEVDAARRILLLALPNATVRGLLGPSCPRSIGAAFGSLSQRIWVDPFVETLMKRLWESAGGTGALDSYLADGILTSILSQLLIRAGTSLQPDTATALPHWRLRRVKAFVDANLGRPIDLDDLAEAAGLSRRHFARSFKAELGETPHRWLMRRRLDRARLLLGESRAPLGEIAELCGFSSQSHLTTALRRTAGVTPHRLRRDVPD